MTRLLDDVDIVNQRLTAEISKLEGELTVLRERHEAVHDNLETCRNDLRKMQSIQQQFSRLEKDYNVLLNALREISKGAVSDSVSFAKRRLEDVE